MQAVSAESPTIIVYGCRLMSYGKCGFLGKDIPSKRGEERSCNQKFSSSPSDIDCSKAKIKGKRVKINVLQDSLLF